MTNNFKIMKNTIVSRFKNYQSTHPENINLWDWLNDDSYKNEVDFIRSINDKIERNKIKSSLPAILPSGIFTKRRADCLVKHSGFICIDIDSGDNPDIIDFCGLRDRLKNITNISYSGLSVSGNGVFCLIPILFPEKHKEHFKALEVCFKKIGVVIDKACSDVSRLRGYSYDKDAYFNENAVMFNEVFEYKFDASRLQENKIKERSNSNEESTYGKVLKVVNQINQSGVDITEKYNQWFQIGCSLANEFGEEGRGFFHIVSQYHPKYHPESCDRKFSECLQGNYADIGIGTFFHWAKEYGVF